jgi:D-alanyl-D-alanine carboxypeptidase
MFFTSGLQPTMPKASEMLAGGPAASEPMVVYTGPKKTGAALIAAIATDSEKQTPAKRGKRSRVAAVKPDAGAAPKANAKPSVAKSSDAKSSDAKPAAKPVHHASVKPDATAKPAAAADKPAAAAAPKPVKPKAAAKPKTDTKPAG